MAANTYIVNSERFATKITFKFNLNGILCGIDIEESLTLEQTELLLNGTILLESHWLATCKKHKVEYKHIPSDLSFDNFWNTYDYKDGGSKLKASEAWKKLSDFDKASALSFIKKYKEIKTKQNIALQYGVTYLNQKMWNN